MTTPVPVPQAKLSTLVEVQSRFVAWRKNRQTEITKKAGEFELVLEAVTSRTGALCNEFIDCYHYLG